jgi:hypothetical protein
MESPFAAGSNGDTVEHPSSKFQRGDKRRCSGFQSQAARGFGAALHANDGGGALVSRFAKKLELRQCAELSGCLWAAAVKDKATHHQVPILF